MTPDISVIIPVYNVRTYLEECLDSVIGQSFENFEIVCVNDGSTDGSDIILKKYASMDSRIRVVDQKNQGLSVARNTGIDNALGEYICFVDSDDMLEKDALERLWRYVRENKGIEIIGYETGDLVYESNDLDKKDSYYDVINSYPGIQRGRELFTELIENNEFVESAWLILANKAWLNKERIRFVEGALFEDSAFALECYFKSNKMMHVSEKIYRYRVRRNSIMTRTLTFDHEKWRIWQFVVCLKYIFSKAENDREKAALVKYARQILGNIKDIYSRISIKEKERFDELNIVESLMFDVLSFDPLDEYNEDLELRGLISLVEKKNRILVYGAGKVGRRVFFYLKENGLEDHIAGFAVSETKNESMIEGKMVKYIGDYDPTEIDLIIISVANEQKSLLETAKRIGFTEIRIADKKIRKELVKLQGNEI
ncbi:Glycosyltransferase involved in cell wall bisynthesis [Lachnospiraceae bacterium]|nr:Glycosyltransferase involved in cell wall bisynthesis [Lachnospiraceae bacterium]